MMSSGGLTAAELFRGKDAILSGPAAGVVGMAETGRSAGFPNLIGFDMGGTSTDVSHFAGEYERAFETEVAGVRMRAPMMLIHTVAAGGGSILHFDGARFRVGPDSAGANPGPKCYRRGGPLAVTDANVMIGKLIPDFFPKIFGPAQDQPLDAEAVRAAFAEAGERNRRRPHAGTGCRRLHPDRGRKHGERDQEDFRAARLRRHALRAQLLRRRRRPARLPRRRRARHDDRADPSVLVPALGLRHGARRHPRNAPAGDRAAVQCQGACGAQQDRRQAIEGRAQRSQSARASRRRASRFSCARTFDMRGTDTALVVEGRFACRHEGDLRESAQSPVRLHRPRQGTGRRSGVGRGGRRRRALQGADAQDDAPQAALTHATHAFLLRRQMAPRARLHPRAACAGSKGEGSRDRHRAASDRRRRGRLAGRDHRRESPRAAAGRETLAPARDRHACRPGDARSVQQPVHVDRRADGRRAAEHRLFGQHQGAARFLLRGVRRHRIARRQRPAHAGASRLDGQGSRDRHPREQRQHPPGRRLCDQRALQRRHASARHHRVHAGVRRRARSCSGWPRAAITPMSAASRPARCRPTRRPSSRKASTWTISGWSSAAASARRN